MSTTDPPYQKKRRQGGEEYVNSTTTPCRSSTTTKKDDDDDISNDTTNQKATTTSRDYYFDSYAHHGIHEEMLKDQVRTHTYRDAILNNQHLFRNKIVLDVGCGTGILSMFAAQAGASHVYAIDCSNIVDKAREIVQLNGYADVITLIKGKVEEVELPELYERRQQCKKVENNAKKQDQKEKGDINADKLKCVDIIISEWMGYFLLYESMLDTVLFARDKWLISNGEGVIFPDKAIMYLCAAEDEVAKADRIDFWSNVYGFDMSPIRNVALHEPIVDVIDPKQIVTEAVPILSIDLLTCKRGGEKENTGDQNNVSSFQSDFTLVALRDDYLHGLVAYFECAFTQVHKPIGFTTSPLGKYTHWKQTIFYLEEKIVICKGEIITGKIGCKPNPRNGRDLDIDLKIKVDGRYSKVDSNMNYHLR